VVTMMTSLCHDGTGHDKASVCQSQVYCLYRQSALLNGNHGHQRHLCTLIHTSVYLTCIKL
jgi:hypothetical protein